MYAYIMSQEMDEKDLIRQTIRIHPYAKHRVDRHLKNFNAMVERNQYDTMGRLEQRMSNYMTWCDNFELLDKVEELVYVCPLTGEDRTIENVAIN